MIRSIRRALECGFLAEDMAGLCERHGSASVLACLHEERERVAAKVHALDIAIAGLAIKSLEEGDDA